MFNGLRQLVNAVRYGGFGKAKQVYDTACTYSVICTCSSQATACFFKDTKKYYFNLTEIKLLNLSNF